MDRSGIKDIGIGCTAQLSGRHQSESALTCLFVILSSRRIRRCGKSYFTNYAINYRSITYRSRYQFSTYGVRQKGCALGFATGRKRSVA
jgi:hypothetical protein